ncbi:tRNA-guanine transglycosylase [Artomyces pyxidatus]|uniref:tRNA-guanine transglycosylase n=1 Tax=Artomyces pyxidatus TaxID=48021 RepID=A0ACB8SXF5_9AGAM|nr:tRNA-guanine transglycosylase [Artomyces pyxidatus]
MSYTRHTSTFRFELLPSSPESTTGFGPRLGKTCLERYGEDGVLEIVTPGFITSTSRGVVPHLSRDNTDATDAIRWAHVPFETFLEHTPPVPTLQSGSHPLHKFLGFRPNQHILTMTLRDPSDDREMPANGHSFVSAYSLRGVRKVSPGDWRKYVLACDPDIAIALSDTPFTTVAHSQKRTTKSLERSAAWLADLLQAVPSPGSEGPTPRLNVFVHMAGGVIAAARHAFSVSLLEPLYEREAETIKPFTHLDEGVSGYTFDLIPLYDGLSPSSRFNPPTPSALSTVEETVEETAAALDPPHSSSPTAQLVPLLHASLVPLPKTKPRIVHSAGSPHVMLALIRDVGIDLFDAHWAQRAADIGIALDFVFPAPPGAPDAPKALGNNLYDARHAHDFSPFADSFRTCADADARPVCPCIACSPSRHAAPLRMSALDEPLSEHAPTPFTRAYVHHLLHTHEMSAHALLTAHNLSVLDAFFACVRRVLADRPADFAGEVERFCVVYDGTMAVWEEAKATWAEVALARGKGRLAREKERQEKDALGTAVEL